MQGFTLTIIDSTGIQPYIFGSNKLKENIGASHLVEQIGMAWLHATLNKVAKGAHNFDPESEEPIAVGPLETDSAKEIEVIYRGGGNVVLLSRTEPLAKQVVRELSRTLLQFAPGLEIAAAHQTIAEGQAIGGEDGAYNLLLGKLNQAKQQRRQSTSQLGLGVTLACRATGMPAVRFDKEEARFVSAEIWAKLGAVGTANKRLQTQFPDIETDYAFSNDFDDFGRSRDDNSYIAVIHADGNGMGKRFEQLVMQFVEESKNRACLDSLGKLSRAVERSGLEALRYTLRQLTASFATQGKTELDRRMQQFAPGLQRDKQTSKPILPLRPLVFGGDDLTLVCDGRLGLPLATVYLRAFHERTAHYFAQLDLPVDDTTIKAILEKPAHACAGVAIVKTHYPFARAYGLSSSLCDNAKTELQRKTHNDASALDWHFAASGINADLGELRSRQYGIPRKIVLPESPSDEQQSASLMMRPITVYETGVGESWRNWNVFKGLIETFSNDELWSERRNKVVALREALRMGPEEVERFLRNYRVAKGLLPEIVGADNSVQTTGWSGDRSGYFDAIEALEFYLPIEPVAAKGAK